MRFLRSLWHVAAKDLRCEVRSRENLITVLFFALVVLVIFHFAFDLARLEFATVGPGLIWVAVSFAGMLGLQTSFARERDEDGLAGLLLSASDPAAVYLGKAFAALVALLIPEALFVPAAGLLFNADLRPVAAPLALVLLIHTAGFVAVGTLFAAMAIKVRRGYLLLPVLQFTMIVPLLMSAVKATSGVLQVGDLTGAGIWLRVGLAYDMVFFSVATMLFEPLIED
ncbi:MAG: heme exporter protein CcmB [Acidobacteriota bacterium]